jgi:hypothetical protein
VNVFYFLELCFFEGKGTMGIGFVIASKFDFLVLILRLKKVSTTRNLEIW